MSDGEAAQDREFEALLEHIRDNRGFDFTGYKRSTLRRRIAKRMEAVGVETFSEYADHLQVHPDEFTDLFNFILINVTAFFRDDQIWKYMGDEVIPLVIERKDAVEPIRVWDAGCASGQEAYTIAMLLAESLGKTEFARRVKIYATDVDEEALDEARLGSYSEKQMEPVPRPLVKKYFQKGPNSSYVFDKDLRRSVIFGRHDLIRDAPISRIDLLACRNTLMYFNADMQARIMANFRFALDPNGFLLLGRAEMLFTRFPSFAPMDLKRRVFTPATSEQRVEAPVVAASRDEDEGGGELTERAAAFEGSPVPQLLLNREGRLIQANAKAREIFGLTAAHLGKLIRETDLSFRPLELATRIDQAHQAGKTIVLTELDWSRFDGDSTTFEVQVVPLFAADGRSIGTTVLFNDVGRYVRLEQELQTSHQEIETAMEELQSTNEELETTNEELQSTNEELETTNEELQSTNEELETMNEELQSANEELETVNEEARTRALELNRANLFLESVLASVQAAMVVVDVELRVDRWNEQAEDLWGLREEEVVGQSFAGLDIGLPVEELVKPIRAALSGSQEIAEVGATTRRGRSVTCRVTCSPLLAPGGDVAGAILLMEAT